MRNLVFYFVAVAMLSSCASALKKKCEKTNWFNHGQSVAMGGNRLNADSFVKQCEKEEVPVDYAQLDLGFKKGMANYCEPQTVFQTGKSGKHFSPDLCGTNLDVLNAKHKEGVREFCEASNGYRVAAQGWKYNKICPKNMEKAFLKEYDRGRKVYLTGLIDEKNDKIRDIERSITQTRRDIKQQQKALAVVDAYNQGRTAPTKNPVKGITKNSNLTDNREYQEYQRKRRQITYRIQNLQRQIKASENTRKQLKAEIAAHKRERASLQ